MLSKQALGNILWGMADILRDKVEDYKAYILSLLFFKRLSDNYLWENENGIKEFIRQYGTEPNEKQRQKIIRERHDFIIPPECFWKDVKESQIDKKNETLNHAVVTISDTNPILKGIINTVRWNEPAPDGSGGKKLQPDVLSSLINYLDPVDLSNRNASVDILGDAYEYLIKRFADENKGGTTAGQFYTPQEVVDIIVRYLKPQKGNQLYDPTCGSGGFLINAAKYVKSETGSAKNIRLCGQENVWNTWAIANINMILHGLDAQIKQGDTILEPKFLEEDNELHIRTFDLVMANFPFSQENWWKNGKPKTDNKGKAVLKKDGSPQLEYPDKSTFNDPYERFIYGIPPFSNGDFTFLQHIIASLDDIGKAGVVCPQGVLFRGQPEKNEEEDGQNRKADDEYLIRRGFLQGIANSAGEFNKGIDIIDAIVVLPPNLFYGTTIPGSIIFFNKQKPEDRKGKVLMVNAAKEGWYKESANMNTLLPPDILRISTMLESWGDLDKAKIWIDSQKQRLMNLIQDDLDFKLNEIELDTAEDLQIQEQKTTKTQELVQVKTEAGKKPTKTELTTLEKAQEKLTMLLDKKQQRINDAEVFAEHERLAISQVEIELIDMLNDPEKRRKYFSVVDMEEIEENEFNLNLPRYVDTFEPEEEIDLKTAIQGFKDCLAKEDEQIKSLIDLLEIIQ
ncbi:MAG: N-6 DNA methylase [Candidatus Cloacimonetes bacterium]|nr:N-6 DNA methylase [Candidatus Cloacimonadota bacterium]